MHVWKCILLNVTNQEGTFKKVENFQEENRYFVFSCYVILVRSLVNLLNSRPGDYREILVRVSELGSWKKINYFFSKNFACAIFFFMMTFFSILGRQFSRYNFNTVWSEGFACRLQEGVQTLDDVDKLSVRTKKLRIVILEFWYFMFFTVLWCIPNVWLFVLVSGVLFAYVQMFLTLLWNDELLCTIIFLKCNQLLEDIC